VEKPQQGAAVCEEAVLMGRLMCLTEMILAMILSIMPAFLMSVEASEITMPLPVRNLYPPMMRFFDPTPDSALRSYDPTWSFEFNQHYSTVNVADNSTKAQLLVDMELYVLDPVIRYAVNSGLELTLRTPVLMPASGVFDSAIQSFHDAFSMPDGGRKFRPNDSFAYVFNPAKGTGWRGRSRVEIGNIELSARYHLLGEGEWKLAALAAVKLPTASKARGWGSGEPDLAVGTVTSWKNSDWFAHLEGWVIQPLAKDQPGIHYGRYLRGSVVAGYQLFDSAALIVQAQGGSSPYNTGISGLDHPPFLISFGLRGQLTTGMGWHATIVENISQVTTQDISVAVGLSQAFE